MSGTTDQPAPEVSAKVPENERLPMTEKVADGLGKVGAGIQENAEKMVMNPVFVIGVGNWQQTDHQHDEDDFKHPDQRE